MVIVADRGFRRASLLKYLRGLGHYVIRVCGNVWISTHENARRKHTGILGDIKIKAGQRICIHNAAYQNAAYQNAAYQKTLGVPTNLILGRLEAERAKKLREQRS